MKLLLALLTGALLSGCHLGAGAVPVSLLVSPQESSVPYAPDVLSGQKLSARLSNTSTRDVRVVPTGRGPINVDSIRCGGKANPFTARVAFVTGPTSGYDLMLRVLRPGEAVTIPIRIVQVDWDKDASTATYYHLASYGRCSIRFVYASPQMTGEIWKAYSNKVVIDVKP